MNEKSEKGSMSIDYSTQQVLLDFEHELRNLCNAMQSASAVIRLDTGISNDSFEMLATNEVNRFSRDEANNGKFCESF